jgi:hypothetical protein
MDYRKQTFTHYKAHEKLLMSYVVTCMRRLTYKKEKYKSSNFDTRYTLDLIKAEENDIRKEIQSKNMNFQYIRKVMTNIELELTNPKSDEKIKRQINVIEKSPSMIYLYDLFLEVANSVPDKYLKIKTSRIPDEEIQKYERIQQKNRYIQMSSPKQKARREARYKREEQIEKRSEYVNNALIEWVKTNPPLFPGDTRKELLRRFDIEQRFISAKVNEMFEKDPETKKMFFENEEFAEQISLKLTNYIREKCVAEYNRYMQRKDPDNFKPYVYKPIV